MATSQNRKNTRISSSPTRDINARGGFDPRFDAQPSGTDKKNYTAVSYGNDHGTISFGHIHKQADVTSDILLQASDGRHSISLDKDGERKGGTQITAPGRISIEAGEDLKKEEDALWIHTSNGNIDIVATRGKIRFFARDIEMTVMGEGSSEGNIKFSASNKISADGKEIHLNAKSFLRLGSTGKIEMVAKSYLKMYASLIKGITDACANQDAKNGGRKFRSKYNK